MAISDQPNIDESLKNEALYCTRPCTACARLRKYVGRGNAHKSGSSIRGYARDEDKLKQVPGLNGSAERAWINPFKADSLKRLIQIDGLYVSPFYRLADISNASDQN